MVWVVSPAAAVSSQKGQESDSCLGSPSMELETQGIPRELLVFVLHWKPEEEGVSQQRDREACQLE